MKNVFLLCEVPIIMFFLIWKLKKKKTGYAWKLNMALKYIEIKYIKIKYMEIL